MDKISSLKTQEYLDNWNDHWQNYLILNNDLKEAGINCKRKSKNHYIKHGIDENRQVERSVPIDSIVLSKPIESPKMSHFVKSQNTSHISQKSTYNFIIQKSMFVESI
jgi:hypothetical protein